MRSRASVIVPALLVAVALAGCSKSSSTSGGASSPAAPSLTAPSAAASSEAPSPTASTSAGMATFTSTSPAYSFRYSSSWAKQDVPPAEVLLYAPGGGPGSAFRTNVNLVLQKVPSGTSLDSYTQSSQDQLPQAGFTVVAVDPGTMGGQPASVIESTAEQNGLKLHLGQFITINGGYGYILTYTALDSEFDANYQAAVKMAESFSFGG